MKNIGKTPPLIVDPDQTFLNSIRKDSQDTDIRPILAETVDEAEIYMSNPDCSFSGIFINPNIEKPDGIRLIRYAHLNKTGTPIYLIENEKTREIKEDELQKLAVHDVLYKPITYEKILLLIAPIVQTFDADHALKLGQKDSISVNQVTQIEDNNFLPILAHNFLSGKKTFFHLFVRIGAEKYLKILNAGDSFSPDRLIAYLDKGVRKFYIRKETQASYLAYCDHLATSLLDLHNAPIEIKASQTLNMGHETISYLSRLGLSKDNVSHAVHFTSTLQRLTQMPDFVRHSKVKEFLLNLSAYEHGVATAAISSLIMRHDGVHSGRLRQIVGLASLFHDIGMHSDLPQDCEERLQDLSKIQLCHFIDHPAQGAQLMSEIRGMDPTISTIIAQHHERRSGNGFPNNLSMGNISWLSEVVAISDEFVKLIKMAARDPSINPLHLMEQKFFPVFSLCVVNMFQKAFIQRTG